MLSRSIDKRFVVRSLEEFADETPLIMQHAACEVQGMEAERHRSEVVGFSMSYVSVRHNAGGCFLADYLKCWEPYLTVPRML
jgi:hypothetical protein